MSEAILEDTRLEESWFDDVEANDSQTYGVGLLGRDCGTHLLERERTSMEHYRSEPTRGRAVRQAADAARTVWRDIDFGSALQTYVKQDFDNEVTTTLDSLICYSTEKYLPSGVESQLLAPGESWTCLLRRLVQKLGFIPGQNRASPLTVAARTQVERSESISHEQREFAHRIFFEIDQVAGRAKTIESFKGARVICADNEDTKSLSIEWVFPEFRLSYWIDEDPSESSWCVASKRRIDQRGDGALRYDSIELGLILVEELNERF